MKRNFKVLALLCVITFVGFTVISATKFSSKDYGDPDYKSRNSNAVDKFYEEIVDKSPDLQVIETEYKELKVLKEKLASEFNEYDQVSKRYYKDAIMVSNSISDTTLRRKMISLLTKSQTNYAVKTSSYESALAKHNKNELIMADYHRVIKLVRTMPAIELYQNASKPSLAPFENLSKSQLNLVEKIKSQTPAF